MINNPFYERKSDGSRRRQFICELLMEKGSLDAGELARQLGVSAPTISRDLEKLEAKGVLLRFYGGAKANPSQLGGELDFGLRLEFHSEAKRRIARKAGTLIQDGDVIYLDAGTTAMMVAEVLTSRSALTVVTHSLAVMDVLRDVPGIKLLMVGGLYLPRTRSFVGTFSEEMIHSLRFRKIILSTRGIDIRNRMLTMSTFEEVPIKRAAIAQSDRVILVADRSKFENPSLISNIPLAGIHTVITDTVPADEALTVLHDLGIQLLTADDSGI